MAFVASSSGLPWGAPCRAAGHALQRRAGHPIFSPVSCRVPLRVGPVTEDVIVTSFKEQASKEALMVALENDLRDQWTRPSTLNFDLFAPDVQFSDPMTNIRGRAQYRGMLLSIPLLLKLLFKAGTARFELTSCALEPGDVACPDGFIVTRFQCKARTRWGQSDVVISGTDRFWLAQERRAAHGYCITYHQSTWDQTAKEVRAAFYRRRK